VGFEPGSSVCQTGAMATAPRRKGIKCPFEKYFCPLFWRTNIEQKRQHNVFLEYGDYVMLNKNIFF
jgi:hypothetical protein